MNTEIESRIVETRKSVKFSLGQGNLYTRRRRCFHIRSCQLTVGLVVSEIYQNLFLYTNNQFFCGLMTEQLSVPIRWIEIYLNWLLRKAEFPKQPMIQLAGKCTLSLAPKMQSVLLKFQVFLGCQCSISLKYFWCILFQWDTPCD
jgi:hypothetical protein